MNNPINAAAFERLIRACMEGKRHGFKTLDLYSGGLPSPQPRRVHGRKIGRNEPSPCNGGRKFKHCCLPRREMGRFQDVA